jgi:hypothetical protein
MHLSPRPSLAGAARRSAGIRSSGLTLLCIGVLGLPAGVPARNGVADACDPASSRQLDAARSFLGYACRDDRCNSHKAGFDWAERNGVVDTRACTARNDPGFAEGCRAFVEDAVTAEQAGFEWARENEFGDSCHCAGAGPRFEAGCEAYVAGFAQ